MAFASGKGLGSQGRQTSMMIRGEKSNAFCLYRTSFDSLDLSLANV